MPFSAWPSIVIGVIAARAPEGEPTATASTTTPPTAGSDPAPAEAPAPGDPDAAPPKTDGSATAPGAAKPPPSKRARAQAARAVKRGKAAAAAGDYATALVAFTEAAKLDPSPAIAFNIAVCHHASMLAATPEDAARAGHRDAAIASYEAYLAASPDATDRADVERIIAELKPPAVPPPIDEPPPVLGPPPELRDAVTRIDPTLPEEAEPKPPPQPVTAPPTRAPAYVGPFVPIVLAHLGRLSDTDLVERLPLVGLGIRGGALAGRRERLEIGGEIGVYGQPADGDPRHRLLDGHGAGTIGFRAAIGRKRRLAIGGGGLLGLLFETLHHRGPTTLTCPTATEGRVSRRTGLLVGGRFAIGVLLGRRRNHELGLRITPALALTGSGNAGDPRNGATSCEQSPFGEAGLPGGAALVTMIDLGYAPRF